MKTKRKKSKAKKNRPRVTPLSSSSSSFLNRLKKYIKKHIYSQIEDFHPWYISVVYEIIGVFYIAHNFEFNFLVEEFKVHEVISLLLRVAVICTDWVRHNDKKENIEVSLCDKTVYATQNEGNDCIFYKNLLNRNVLRS